MSYGITKKIKKQIDKNLKKQKAYLEFNGLKSMSANMSPKEYFSELNNRINTLLHINQQRAYKPVFLTITAPSKYHPYRTLPNGQLAKNKKYENYSISDTKDFLTHFWQRIQRLKIIKKLSKENHKMSFIRVFEPHKSGVPHLHILLFIPQEYITPLEERIDNLCQKEDIKQFKYLTDFQDERHAVGYIMKYINKTFKNANTNKIDDIGYWYIHHKIRRITTSRDIVPLSIYRNIRYKPKNRDLKEVTQWYKNGQIYTLFNKKTIIKIGLDEDNEIYEEILYNKKEVSHLKSEQFKLKVRDKQAPIEVIFEDSGEIKFLKDVSTSYSDRKYELIDYDDSLIIATKELFETPKIPIPAFMKDYTLVNYLFTLERKIESEEFNKTDYVRYGVAKKEAQKRNLIEFDEIINLNDYSLPDMFDYEIEIDGEVF